MFTYFYKTNILDMHNIFHQNELTAIPDFFTLTSLHYSVYFTSCENELRNHTQYKTRDQEHNPKSCLLLRFVSSLQQGGMEQLEKCTYLLYWGFLNHKWQDGVILANQVVIYSRMWKLEIRDPFTKTGKWIMYMTQKRLTKLKFAVWSHKLKDEALQARPRF